jgi:hypothetical protein
MWNAVFILGAAAPPTNPLTIHALLPIALAFVVALAIPRSQRLQALVLRPGRHVGEMMPVLRLLAVVTGVLLVAFTVAIVASRGA